MANTFAGSDALSLTAYRLPLTAYGLRLTAYRLPSTAYRLPFRLPLTTTALPPSTCRWAL